MSTTEAPAAAIVKTDRPLPGWTRWGFPALLIVLVAAAFANAAHDTFVYDDKFFVSDQAALDLRSILRLFREDAWSATGTPSDVYRPLLILSIMVEGALHGARARWFHLTNIGLQIATTLMLYGMLLELLRGRPWARLAAFLSSLIFGLHPVHTEVVNSIFNRSEMMATLFVLSAIWIVHRYVETAPIRTWIATAALYFLALLCRESAAPLPLLLFLTLTALRPELVLRRRSWRLLWPALLLVIIALIYLQLRRSALSLRLDAYAVAKIKPQVWDQRLGQMASMLRLGLRMIFVPHPLRASYEALGQGGPLHALAIHVLLIGSALMMRRSAPGFLLGLGFYYLALLPSTRLMTRGTFSVTMGERYLYLPSVGLALGMALVLPQLIDRYGKRLIIGCIAVAAGLFFVATGARNADWSSDMALWQAEARVAPDSSNTWRFLSGVYLEAGRPSEAAQLCDKHLPRFDQGAKLYMHCGIAYEAQRRLPEAERAYRRAVELGLGPVAQANLGRFYFNTGRLAEAERQYRAAVDGEYLLTRQHYRRGQYLLRFYPERRDEAALEFQRSLEAQPRYAPARQALDALQRSDSNAAGAMPRAEE